MENENVRNMAVEVRGDHFYSKEVRKVMIRVYKPMTFVQTDKPIYLPGQKGNTGLIISKKKKKKKSMQMIAKISKSVKLHNFQSIRLFLFITGKNAI